MRYRMIKATAENHYFYKHTYSQWSNYSIIYEAAAKYGER